MTGITHGSGEEVMAGCRENNVIAWNDNDDDDVMFIAAAASQLAVVVS